MKKSTVIGFNAHFALAAIALAFASHGAVAAEPSQAAAHAYSIPDGTLGEALTEFADQANLKLIFNADLTRGFKVPALRETVTVEQGLNKLLKDSGLSYRVAGNNTTIIEPKPVVEETQPRSDTTLPKVKVSGEAGYDAADRYITATAPSAEEAQADLNESTAGAISVIKAEDYKTGAVLCGQDALRYAPGVYSQSRSGYEDNRLSIRGSGLSSPFGSRGVRLLRDGLPLSRADGFTRSFYAAYDDAEYVAIYRGASALEYGSSQLGGAINLVSPTGYSRPGLRTRLNGGSNAYVGGNISYGGVFGAGWDGYAAISGFRTDGFRDNDHQSRAKFFGNLGYRFSERSEGRFYFEIEQQKLNQPGSLTRAMLEDDPTQANAGSARAKATLNLTPRSYVGYKHSFLLGDDKLDVGAYWTNTDVENPTNFARFFYNDTDYGVSLRHEINGTLFGARNRFVWGASAAQGRAQTDTFGPIRFGNFVAEPNPGEFNDVRNDSRNLGAFAQEQIYLTPEFSLLAGGQYVYAKRETREKVPTPPTNFPIFFPKNEEKTYNGFSPKLGAIWDVRPDAQLFANVSRSFEPPTGFEFFSASGKSLDAQTAWTAEVGTRGQTKRFSWDLAFYHAWVKHEILSIANPPNSGRFETNNVDNTTHLGIEAGVSTLLPLDLIAADDALKLNLNYAWNHFRFDNDRQFGNNELPGIPEHVLNLEALYRHPSGFFFGPNLQVASSWFADQANSLQADSFAILGLRGGYENKRRGLRVFVDLRNLADEAYAASTEFLADARGRDTAVFNPGINRTVFVGIEINSGLLQ
ncbi:MAG: TonB-dependent receptor domain-containing protein [Methylococcales bacterium]